MQSIPAMRPLAPFRMTTFGLNRQGRDIAIGDIHGCFGGVTAALEKIKFDEKVDRLFCVGDLIDRGPQSDRVLEWLDKPWLYAIMGNHEQMVWRSVKGIPFDRRYHKLNGGDWLELLPADEQVTIGERLSGLPLVIEVETPIGIVGLIHSDFSYDDWSELREIDWSQLDDDHPFVRCCLWAPVRFKHQYRRAVKNVRAVIHGHVTVPDVTVLGNTFYIDTGGWLPEGRFTLLNLHTLMPELPRESPDRSAGEKV
jgi:serine/threonine protein phosphatase 1